MRDLSGRLRVLVEAVVPWFDRASEDRAHAEIQRDLRASRALRQRVEASRRQDLLRGSFTRAGERISRR